MALDKNQTPAITAELLARGYTRAELDKLWSGNLLRVWRRTEAVSKSLAD